ncbi:MAG: homoserine dehydrogenase [Chloroflexi bacterium]|nr:homoserine dehydrogenase [Chloroflexota bacterium]
MEHTIALLGFGNVLRAFAELLEQKNPTLEQRYGYRLKVVGISTNSHGRAIDPAGIKLSQALELVRSGEGLDSLDAGWNIQSTPEFIQAVPAEVILEATWLDPTSGQPAIDFVRTALETGKHVVTANKGPVAFAYQSLRDLARQKDLGFLFESTVMDGMPLHSLAREGLLGLEISRIRGILNSTTNAILTRLEEGIAFEKAVAEMQEAGLAEADPSNDVDGWDSAVKIVVLANVFMGGDLRPSDVHREGIRDITLQDAKSALTNGERIKLVCEATQEGGHIHAQVRPLRLPLSDPLANTNYTVCAVSIDTDVLPQVSLIEGPSSPTTTAYGMLVDTLNVLRGRR